MKFKKIITALSAFAAALTLSGCAASTAENQQAKMPESEMTEPEVRVPDIQTPDIQPPEEEEEKRLKRSRRRLSPNPPKSKRYRTYA